METKQLPIFSFHEVKEKRIIKTVSYNQQEIMQNICALFCPEGIELDPTYSIGNFYGRIPRPKYRYDINPQVPEVTKADCRQLPHSENSITSINFDPPFLATTLAKEEYDKNSNIILNRFGFYKNMPELWQFYCDSLKEFYRILKPNGILIFKCQDAISGGQQYLSHVEIINCAISIGLYPVDLFVLLAKNRIIGQNGDKQQHARKYHSYFIVFKKQPCPIRYRHLACNNLKEASR
jgi:hypothetical protein